ncbi:glycosyltransferase family protein [Oceanibacterium hippocampi]|uniref:Glycosyl transferase family 28 C-terminal domain-containing protein n=1 Tax=Oceanibacterium hippocampi TaxID=745714 RepID=A0A1Y5RKT7_9PROT|nr:glycosyltransferase [Oceanibacterium hippocampi]SLN19908.1 hypothetical protein OCH7691_00465 [Oceanibacterium hippocampi]
MGSRILIYSHDSFGLGHLRRCLTIAHSLVDNHEDLSILILSGSPIIGSFDFRNRVDFVRVPGVIKLRDGEYTSLSLAIHFEETLALRASIIKHTAEVFDPNIFIVDKEPLGLRGEVGETLELLKGRGTRLVLGLRDVLDEPRLLAPEWERKNVLPSLCNLYDEIWVYGLREICNPLEGIGMPASVQEKMVFTGYLPRKVRGAINEPLPAIVERPYLLVTTGGGGDGEGLIEWVLRAYETDPLLPYPALLVLGPFMQADRQVEFLNRVQRLKRVEAITFNAHLESISAKAAAIVCMGGYNTFCEVLSLNKRALIIPRTEPRMEQFIRASRAEKLGLVRMLAEDKNYPPEVMAEALRALPSQRQPMDVVIPGLLEGLVNVNRLATPWLGQRNSEAAESRAAAGA